MTNVPEIRFKGFADAWEQRKLVDNVDEILDFRGKSPARFDMEWGNKGYLVLSALNVKDGFIDKTIDAKFGDSELYNIWMGKKRLKKGDVLFTTEAPLGNVAQIPDNENYFLNQRVVAFKTNPIKTDNDFLAQLLRSPNAQDLLMANATGGTAKGIGMKEFVKLSAHVPISVDEQRKLGAFFRTLDNTIAIYKRKLEGLRELKKAYLQMMFPQAGEAAPRIRFAGFDEPWEQKGANEIFYTVSDKGHSHLPVLSASQEHGMILRNEIGIDIKFDRANTATYKRVLPGQFVIHLRSFQGGLAYSSIEGITSPAYTVIDFIEKDKQIPEFWIEVMRSEKFIKMLESVTYGIRDGRSISFNDFSILKMPYPSYDEQMAIGQFFRSLDSYIHRLQSRTNALAKLKSSYLQKMFT